MANPIEIRVPDLGEFETIEIIEVLVTQGDTVDAEQSLITLESDKASMEIPSTHGGTVTEITVQVGDKVSTGDLIATLAESDSADTAAADAPAADVPLSDQQSSDSASATPIPIVVPDLGEFEQIEVIELLVAEGDTVSLDQSLITLESDKASMEIPSTAEGIVERIVVNVGDRLSKGDRILDILGTEAPQPTVASPATPPPPSTPSETPAAPSVNKPQPVASPTAKIADESYRKAHASLHRCANLHGYLASICCWSLAVAAKTGYSKQTSNNSSNRLCHPVVQRTVTPTERAPVAVYRQFRKSTLPSSVKSNA